MTTSSASSRSYRYRHTQVGWATLLVVGVVGLIVAGTTASQVASGALAWSNWAVWLGPVILGVVAALFHSQTVEVDDETLRWYFGPGFWRNETALSEIESVQTFTYSRMAGYGIRWTSRGWLYNVSGTRAVEIQTTETTFAIGTDEPERLQSALHEAAGVGT